jgi:Yip1-like protein
VTDTTVAAASNPGAKSLPARLAGVLFAPRATYAAVAAQPRWFGAFLAVYLVTTAAATGFMSTEVGRNAVIDQQITQSEAYGRHLNQQQLDTIERISHYYAYFTPVLQLVSLGFGSLLIAGIAFAIFNALLGGDATFKQAYAVVVHSGVVLAALSLFSTPLAYARQTLSSATNLGVFVPFLDDASFAARLLGSIDLIYVWWMVSVAIGLGVLYRRRTGPIATTLLAIYVVIGLVIAAIKTAASGA